VVILYLAIPGEAVKLDKGFPHLNKVHTLITTGHTLRYLAIPGEAVKLDKGFPHLTKVHILFTVGHIWTCVASREYNTGKALPLKRF
jgi:hypothetical protein